MNSTTLGIKVDPLVRARLQACAERLQRTPHWLMKQAIFAYLEDIEGGTFPPELMTQNGRSMALDNLYPEGSDTADTFQPFMEFAQSIRSQSVLRAAITAAYRRPEPECVPFLIGQARLPANVAA